MSIIIPQYSEISKGLYISNNTFRIKEESQFLVDKKKSIGLHKLKIPTFDQILKKIYVSALNQLNGNLSETPDKLEQMMSFELDIEFLSAILENQFDFEMEKIYQQECEENLSFPGNEYLFMQVGTINLNEQNQYLSPIYPPKSFTEKFMVQILLENEELPNKNRLENLINEKVSRCPIFTCNPKIYSSQDVKKYLKILYKTINTPYYLEDLTETFIEFTSCMLLEDILYIENEKQTLSETAFDDLQTYMNSGRPLQ